MADPKNTSPGSLGYDNYGVSGVSRDNLSSGEGGNRTVFSSQEQEDKLKKTRKKLQCVTAFLVIFILVVIALIIALAVVASRKTKENADGGKTTPKPVPPTIPTKISQDTHVPIDIILTRTDLSYSATLQDKSSPLYKAYQELFCHTMMDTLMKENLVVDQCHVSMMMPGSVRANTQSQVRIPSNMERAQVISKVNMVIKEKAKSDKNLMVPKENVTVNYCRDDTSVCSQICLNPVKKGADIQCACYKGYTLMNDSKTCTDVDECEDSTFCDHDCENKEGDFMCSCRSGYKLKEDRRKCTDIDECAERGKCQHRCVNTAGSYSCSCPPGYQLDDNKITCSDIDECKLGRSPCTQICKNTNGAYECMCRDGYFLNVDRATCKEGTGLMAMMSSVRADLTYGETLDVVCSAMFIGGMINDDVTITWRRGNIPVLAATLQRGAAPFSLTLPVTATDSSVQGVYTCTVQTGMWTARNVTKIYVKGCADTMFECTGGTCIPGLYRCDGDPDCLDGSDEIKCNCTAEQFKCQDGSCIPATSRCDTYMDCPDSSDEYGCTEVCAQPENSPCNATLGLCQPNSNFCTGTVECPNGMDEKNCRPVGDCPIAGQMKCDGKCISSLYVCDGKPQCVDGADESNCPTDSCYQCADNSQCITHEWVCDGVVHCKDGSDEIAGCKVLIPFCSGLHCTLDCPSSTPCDCPRPYVYDPDLSQCINGLVLCDGRKQFTSSMDEAAGCSNDCADGFYKCDSKCLLEVTRCDGIPNCVDGADEKDCECRVGKDQFMCDSGECRPIAAYCNIVIDCPDGSDEKDMCNQRCPSDYTLCVGLEPAQSAAGSQSPECVGTEHVCDGIAQCSTGSDEYDCTCPADHRQCANKLGCVPEVSVCDRAIPDCSDRSDEFEFCSDCARYFYSCDGLCLLENTYCDGKRDCKDGTDEPPNCLDGCAPSQVFCDGACLTGYLVCDGKLDCSDGLDEINCDCPPEYRCDNRVCLEPGRFCDGYMDCDDNSDETRCFDVTSCREGEHACDGRCISHVLLCDGYVNCKDKSDETGCAAKGCNAPTTPGQVLKFYIHSLAFNARPGFYNTSCTDGSCIRMDLWCNGRPDCPDGSDERKDCKIGCPEGAFTCDDGGCVPLQYKCDMISDCGDSSDEKGCDCPSQSESFLEKISSLRETEFQKCDDGLCILKQSFCDGVQSCYDYSDETLERCCKADSFRCLDGTRCIPPEKLLDGNKDCEDNSDELMVPGGSPATCLESEFRCDNTFCLPMEKMCNTVNDCGDWSDEGHPNCTCLNFQKKCANGVCLDRNRFCDGEENCPDGSDEMGCDNCRADQTTCSNSGYCINKTSICDKKNDCGDWSDEAECDCGPEEFKCTSPSVCRPNSDWCDRTTNCPDNSDEAPGCGDACKTGQLQCDGRCVSPEKICDGVRHCTDYMDEQGCDCPWGTFQCADKSFCANMVKFCDGIYDCRDHSDEPEGCLKDCPAGMYMCAGTCRDAKFICDLPDQCPEIVKDLKCSKFTAPKGLCGIPSVRPYGAAVPFIIDGDNAIPHSYPWQIAMEGYSSVTNSYSFRCSGSIISEYWVVTAAHCVVDLQSPYQFRLRAGEFDLTVNSEREQVRLVKEVYPKPSYVTAISDDIAVMKVAEPFIFNKYVSPACLTSRQSEPGTLCVISGWGLAQGVTTDDELTLEQTDIPILDRESCIQKSLGITGAAISDNAVCVGRNNRGGSACQGDSGGPLMCPRDGRYVLEGVTSWGPAGCKITGRATIYNSIPKQMSWITEVTGVLPVD